MSVEALKRYGNHDWDCGLLLRCEDCTCGFAAAIKAAQPEYMCPNCVSPWKCNGPHIPQHTIKGGYLIEEVSSSGYAAGSAGGQMNPAEKMASELEALQKFQQSLQTGNPIPTIHGDAAALIRRLAAALRDAVQILGEGETEWFKRAHAEALRDIKEDA